MLGLANSCKYFRSHRGTQQSSYWSHKLPINMAAPVASAGWPSSSRGVAAVQTGPGCVSQTSTTSTQQWLSQPPAPQQNIGYCDMPTTDSESGSDSGPLRVPLKLVVQDAVQRWFNETLSEARRGDVKQQALLAQMLAEGYGCKRDVEESRRWAERARSRGYQMAGVYCEL